MSDDSTVNSPNSESEKSPPLNHLQRPKEKPAPPRLTRDNIEQLKKENKIEGYFTKPKLGRPPKKKPENTLPPDNTIETSAVSGNQPTQPTTNRITPHKKIRWLKEENFDMLRDDVSAFFNSGESTESDHTFIVATRSLKRYAQIFKEIMNEKELCLEQVTRAMIIAKTKSKKKGLLDYDQLEALEDIIVGRDERNEALTRGEVIDIIMEMSGANRKVCENHFDWLIRSENLPRLKGNGRARKAQATTSKRTQVTVAQQLRWHSTVDEAIENLKRTNQPAEEFEKVIEYFFGNFDETCFLGTTAGNVNIQLFK